MKKKLNFLCFALLILMIVGMVMAVLAGASDFKQGFEESAKASEATSFSNVIGFVGLACLLVYIYASACFVRFILSVNHGEVFTWTNVDLLRTTIVMFSAMSFDGINLLDLWSDAIGIIAVGFFILVIAEAFSIGLKLKEEQDLTI